MADDAIVFALANPDPEVDRSAASQHAAIVATGRSTTRTRSTLCWRSSGSFRGMPDSGAHEITDECLLAAATAIADCVDPTTNANYIVPSVFTPAVQSRGRRGPQSHHLTVLRHHRVLLRPHHRHG